MVIIQIIQCLLTHALGKDIRQTEEDLFDVPINSEMVYAFCNECREYIAVHLYEDLSDYRADYVSNASVIYNPQAE